MAYNTQYLIAFTNELSQEVEVALQKKDSLPPTEIILYDATAVKRFYKAESDQGKYTPIIGYSAEVSFFVREGQPDYWPDFEDAAGDDWKMVITINNQLSFIGFVIPDEGNRPFQDPPYECKLTASDGLGLLKGVDLLQPDGTAHAGDNLISWYIASALQQTGLALPIRVYDNVFHKTMQTPDNDPKWCMFNQTLLEYRTFRKDATSFVSAWEALNIILKETYRLFQWNGRWMIIRLGMIQLTPFATYYTELDYNGYNPIGYIEEDNYSTVGKNDMIYPINEDQNKYHKLAAKSVQTNFDYNIWPEIPKNNKFERGEVFETGPEQDIDDIDKDGNTTEIIGERRLYSIPGWNFGQANSVLPFQVTQSNQRGYRKSVFSVYNTELTREIILEAPLQGGRPNWLQSEGIPVAKGDKIGISFEVRNENKNFSIGGGGSDMVVASAIIVSGNKFYSLYASKNNQHVWKTNFNIPNGIYANYIQGENIAEYKSVDLETPEIPDNGILYFQFVAIEGFMGFYRAYRNFNFEYKPYVAGGYQQVKGDYWITSQDKKYTDKIEEEIFISDSRHKVVKGCLLDLAGNPYTPEWRRHGIEESRHFKQISNLEKYNHYYRRFMDVEGSFTGLTMQPQNNQENVQPIGLHKQFRMSDLPDEDRRFMLIMPFETDDIAGNIRGNYCEVYKDGEVTTYKKEAIELLVQRIRQLIDGTTIPEWQSGGGAPAPGTVGFPPITTNWIGLGSPWLNARRFMVRMNLGAQMTITSQKGTKIERIINPNVGGYALMGFTFSDHVEGDVIVINAYGKSLQVIVQSIPTTIKPDGQQTGDRHEFKYRFE